MASDFWKDEILGGARETLEKVKPLVTQLGMKYVELPDSVTAVGIAVPFSETQYSMLAVMGGGNEGQLYITAGVLRDIQQDRLAILKICNHMVGDNPAYPIYLHDAQIGWDILVSNMFPISLVFDVPKYFANAVRALPIIAESARSTFAEANLGGQPFRWNADDLNRLLTVSTM